MKLEFNRSGIAKVSVVAVLAVLIAGGAIGVYYFTSAPSSSIGGNTTSSSTTQTGTNSAGGPSSGYIDSTGQPQGAWADYLGYIPSGYALAPHYANAGTYQCPSGMDPAQCTQFQASCGNGVCDPNESCATCPIDCAPSGANSCDPYTGRSAAPVAICQLAIINGNGNGG